jgi:exosortase
LAFALAILWLPVVYTTGAQWTIFEQYHYGWAVPFMCLFFAWERAQRGKAESGKLKSEDRRQGTEGENQRADDLPPSAVSRPASALRPPSSALWFLISAFCFLFWLSRFLLEANPTWRAPAWGLVIAAAGITLALLYVAGGQTWLRRFLFPVAFFFVAVPWPTPLEDLVTQNLMRLNVAIVIELLNLFNIPALAHGNVIELSRGVVGVEEACSGIRSMQASLMIALFFGEFFRLRVLRRVGLVFGGIVFAMFFNVCRTYFLAWICSRYGNDAVDTWHDRAGFFVLLCFIATRLLALWLARTKHAPRSMPTSDFRPPTSDLRPPPSGPSSSGPLSSGPVVSGPVVSGP